MDIDIREGVREGERVRVVRECASGDGDSDGDSDGIWMDGWMAG